MTQLSGLDAFFLNLEAAAPMHLGAIAIYDPSTTPDGVFDFDTFRAHLENRLHSPPCFRRRVVRVPLEVDHPYWADDAAPDLDRHVHHLSLPRPGSWHQLCQAAGRFHERRLDPARPLWEMEVIEGLDAVPGVPVGSFAVATKVHHAAIDGVAGAQLIAALHDLEPTSEPRRGPSRRVPMPFPSRVGRLARSGLNTARRATAFPRWLTSTVPSTLHWLGELANDEPKWAPRSRFNGSISQHRGFAARAFELARIHEIKKSLTGATVNDVVLTICGGALRTYLGSEGEPTDQTLRAVAPISIRRTGEERAGGNRFSYMTVPIRSDVADPVERLAAVHRHCVEAKRRHERHGGEALTEPMDLIPEFLARAVLSVLGRSRALTPLNRLCNTVITNVPGPPVPLYLAGSRLQSVFGLAPIIDGMGLIHPVFSYCGTLTIALSCCSDMMPDPEFYAECLEQSFRELEHAVCGPAALVQVPSRQPADGWAPVAVPVRRKSVG